MASTGRIFAINLLANSKPAERAFANVGKAAGRIPTPMKIAAGAITAVFAAVTAVAVKSFSELLKLGEEFNNVERIIRVGTGAVGEDLAALQDSFRAVAQSVPNSFGDVASVIAELDTRTDLAGEGLERMAEQMLTLSRLMGSDAIATTRETTRLFNRFGLSAEEASDMLDLLFRASQASGAQIDQLAADVTKNAGALQAMGLSLEESVALFALFEREGVRSRTVVSALQTGFLKLTKDSTVPLNQALADTFTELQTLDRQAAEQKGLEIFGTSALELVDAVRDGRLAVDDFTQALLEGDSTIMGVAEETDGFRVKLDEFKNYLKLQFEGPATAVFDALTEAVDELIPAAERVEEAYSERGLKGALEQIALEWNLIYDQYLEPLWLRFLDFLEFTVIPAALDIGGKIGKALGESLRNAFGAAIENMAQKFLDNPATWLLPSSRLLVAGLRGFGRDLQGEIDLGLPGERRVPIEPPMNPKIPNLPDYPWMQPDFGVGGVVATPGRRAGIGSFVPFAEGGLVLSPTLGLVGEAGPELIVPLDRAPQLGGTTVNVTVTSADPEAVVDAIRRFTRSNGPLGQVVRV